MPRKTDGPRCLEITDRILESLNNGVVPWERPWSSGAPRNAESGRKYRGINRVLLELTALQRGYESSGWLTFNAARRLGGHVRRGETGTLIIYFERRPKRGTEAASWDQEVDHEYVYLARHHFLFAMDQIEGLDALRASLAGLFSAQPPIERAEEVLTRSGAHIVYGGDRACYAPEEDTIYLPPRAQFRDAEGFYATAMHELAHWSGHQSRLNRSFDGRFGEPQYAAEELIAELASAFLCSELGLNTIGSSASYLEGWLRLLEGDCRAIYVAAREGQLAADYLLGEWVPDVVSATELGVEDAARHPELVSLA